VRHLSIYPLLTVILLTGLSLTAQLSPGDLSEAHAHLEGISNCTQCHDLGNKVSNAKCLDCHKEIDRLIELDRGFHASNEVKSKDCFACHSEHHGRRFDMVRFDQEAFDHRKTGYALEGAHAKVDCRECHRPDNIKDAEIRKLKDTFLGLDDACLSCHEDFHQGSMDTDCKQCHGMEAWRPAVRFDHDETDFPLKGGHVDVDCAECHRTEQRNGKDFQVFAPVEHQDCIACHEDPHQSRFRSECKACHTVNSFETFIGKGSFDHRTTSFALKGKHRTVDCFTCHKRSSDPLTVFRDRRGVKENACATCHEDVHEGRFGNDCAKCHQETGFFDLKDMSMFDHDLTDYPLEGRHEEVDCKQCHVSGRFSEPLASDRCFDCHEDYHKGQFMENGVQEDCASCHSVLDGFELSHFSIDDHDSTAFPLQGAHMATPCFACHRTEEEWNFKALGESCIDCHENVHGDTFAIEGRTDCQRCHDSDSWFPSLFDHDNTDFPLEGEHAAVDCHACHPPPEEGMDLVFKIESFECIDCHQ
jgi:hypothetical protein